MKFIHTSDWHLGATLRSHDRAEEHKHFFTQLAQLAAREQPDALLLSGDVYDNPVPSAAAASLFESAVLQLRDAAPGMRIIVIGGNHDSGSRVEQFRTLLAREGVTVIGNFTKVDGCIDPSQFIVDLGAAGVVAAVPYINPVFYPDAAEAKTLRQRERAFFRSVYAQAGELAGERPVVAMAHLAVTTSATLLGEKTGGLDYNNFTELESLYDYLALGHIHRPGMVGSRAAYCGSPIPISFAEDHPHYVYVVEVGARGGEPVVEQVEMEQLRGILTVECESVDEAEKELALLKDDCRCYVRVMLPADATVPVDANDRCAAAAQGREWLFCGCFKAEASVSAAAIDEAEAMDVDDFKRVSPREVARMALESEGCEDIDELLALLDSVINQTETTCCDENS